MTKDEIIEKKDKWIEDIANLVERTPDWVKRELQARFGSYNEAKLLEYKMYLQNLAEYEDKNKEAEETRPLLPPLKEGWPETCPQHGSPTYTHWIHRGGWRKRIWACKTGGPACYYKNQLLKHADETQIALAYQYSDWCIENGIEQKTAKGFAEWKEQYEQETIAR